MQSEDKTSRSGAPSGQTNELPYSIELWNDGGGDKVERILARAVSAQLARAIFKAAVDDHPNRRITLRRGHRIIADTSA